MIYNGIKVILKRFVVFRLSNLKMVGLEARKVNIFDNLMMTHFIWLITVIKRKQVKAIQT